MFGARLAQPDTLAAKLEIYRRVSKKTHAEVVIDRARKFAFAAHKEAKKVAPNKASLARQLVYLANMGKLKITRDGRTAMKEIRARIRASGSVAMGFFAAVRELRDDRVMDRSKSLRSGSVAVNVTADKPRVTITNDMKGIGPADSKHGIVKRAMAATIRDIDLYLRRKQQEARRQAGL